MKRIMVVIDYLTSSKSSWSKKEEVLIDSKRRHYNKSDIISQNGKKYIVLGDHVQLRVIESNDPINPYQSLSEQFTDHSSQRRKAGKKHSK